MLPGACLRGYCCVAFNGFLNSIRINRDGRIILFTLKYVNYVWLEFRCGYKNIMKFHNNYNFEHL